MKIIETMMMKRYMIKLGIRIIVFFLVFGIYLYDKQWMMELAYQPLHQGITLLHLIWFGFMVMMLTHLFPKEPFTMALLKSEKEKYVEVKNYSKLELLEYIQEQNVKAWKVMLIWLLGNAIVGILYSFEWIGQAELFLLTVFYFYVITFVYYFIVHFKVTS